VTIPNKRISPFALRDIPEILPAILDVLERNGVLSLPTESFYGLAASFASYEAVQKVCRLKGRASGHPILLLIGNLSQLPFLVEEIPRAAKCLMDEFWPGPLTIIFPAHPSLSTDLTGGTGTIGVRQPGHPVLLALLNATGPLTGSSANHSHQPPASTAQEVDRLFEHQVDLILDGGPTPGGLPSTLVDGRDPVRVLREGPISRDHIRTTLAKIGIGLAS